LCRKPWQDRRVQRGAFLPFDVLFCGAAAVVELDHALGGSGQVGHDEADARVQLALVPFDLGHHPTGSGPAGGLATEAGVGHDRLLGRSADGSGQEVADPPLQDLIGRQSDGVADAFGLQELVDLRLGEGRIGAEVESDASLTAAADHRLQHEAPALSAMNVARPQHAALKITKLVDRNSG